ncbi:alpha-2-macroglobulin receptor-associated protein isoform X2 [Suncus etruscus]|uniref:alpha-2-macroglobulin receptor-associated protein isoform X2 n=1 Tax=Suncus etruscus TaxID=109475 RepID=UPI00211063A6|nr:alpha-2-macroglobulin receptor-associated protein isoform X2 [Suncus etruscus]
MVLRSARAAPCIMSLSLLLLLLLGLGPAASHGSKYSREKNQPELAPKRAPEQEFRMEKLNQLWDKAHRLQLSPSQLSELHSDLKLQEREEFNWKKLKAEGLDPSGEKEATLIRSLNVIVNKYGLDGRKNAQELLSNAISDHAQDDSLGDPRLEKLWHKAKTSGKFSDPELDKLWRELLHHREKMREYNVLLEALSREEESHENYIQPTGADLGAAALQSRHAALKEQLRVLGLGMERLQRISQQGYGAQQTEFEEPRVLDLWNMAKSANFSPRELESFREELKHFEAKIEKHQHYQQQLEISHQKLRHMEKLGDSEHISRNRERFTQLEDRTKELGYKVKKHFQDLSSRISRGHNEL